VIPVGDNRMHPSRWRGAPIARLEPVIEVKVVRGLLVALLPPQPDRFRALVTGGWAAEEIVRVARAGSRPDHHGNAPEPEPPTLVLKARHEPGAPSGARRRDDGSTPPALPGGRWRP
jgi:hypothetical protein